MPCSSSSFSKSQGKTRAGWQTTAYPSAGVWGGFPSLACLVLSDRSLGATAHGRQEYHPHDGGEERKEKTGTGMVRYTGSPRRGKRPHPRPPALPPRATLLLAAPPGGFVQKVSSSVPPREAEIMEEVVYANNKAAAARPFVCRPAARGGQERVERGEKTTGPSFARPAIGPSARDSTSREAGWS